MSITRPKIFIASILIFHLFLLTHHTFTAWPEMLSFPYLVNSGYRLYSDFVHVYPPLLTFTLSLVYKVFGYNVLALKIFTYSLILVGDVLMYKIALKVSESEKAALIILFGYCVFQTFLDGDMLWFDTALVVPLLFSLLSFLNKRYVLFSVSLISALLIKQTAIVYVVIYLFYLLKEKNYRVLSIFTKTLFFGSFLFLLYLVVNNSLIDFWKWNFYYPFFFWSKFPGYVDFILSKRDIVTIAVLSIAPLMLLFRKKYLISILYFAALIAVYPRFSYFHMQPAIALSAIAAVKVFTKRKLYLIVFAAILFLFFNRSSINATPEDRFVGLAEKNLSIDIAKSIPERSSVLFIGVSSQYYQQNSLYPPTPWMDTYGWYFEMPDEQKRVVTSLKNNPPEYFLYRTPGQGAWYSLGAYEPKEVVSFMLNNYDKEIELTPRIWVYKKKT